MNDRDIINGRMITPDAFRGIAAILVVSEHLMARDLGYADTGNTSLILDLLLFGLMPIFFFYSGYFSLNGLRKSAMIFFKQKTLRLAVPYLTWSSIAVIAKTVVMLQNNTFSICDVFILEISTIVSAQSMWFLIALYLMQILSFAVLRIIKNIRLQMAFFILFILLPLPNVFAIPKIQELLPCFLAGLIYAKNKDKITELLERIKSKYWFWAIAILTLGLAPVYHTFVAENRTGNALTIIPASLLAMAVAYSFWYLINVLLRIIPTLKSFFSVFGKYTLQIYCIHMAFVDYIQVRLPGIVSKGSSAVVNLGYFVLGLLVSSICIFISWLVFDRIPIYQKLMLGEWR